MLPASGGLPIVCLSYSISYLYSFSSYCNSSFSRLLNVVSPQIRSRITPLFAERCRERVGTSGDALALAIRVICCNQVGIDSSTDLSALCKMQDVDGGWKDGWFYRYPTTGMLVGNRGCTTALAINAIKGTRARAAAGESVVVGETILGIPLASH